MREMDLIGRIEPPVKLRAVMNANAVSTTNYNDLGNKPKINGVTLYGDMTPEELGIFYGAPFVANTVAEMTNTDKVYVYTGSETGYTAGNWYYYNGSAWVSGGVYNSVAVETDKTLTQEDKAADAKAVGDALLVKAGKLVDTLSGDIVSFVPDKTIPNLLDCKLTLSPIQSGSGDPSPTNVRPITGHTQATLNRTGKNIALPYAFEQGSLSGSGSHTYSTIRVHSGYIEVEPSKKYAIEITGSAQIYEVHEYVTASGNNTKYTTVNATETAITMASTTHYIRVLARYSNNGTITPSDISGFQVCEGDATDLTTFTFLLGQTVYGSKIDLVTGEGEITRAAITLNGTQNISIVNWRPSANGVGWVYPISITQNKVLTSDQIVPNLFCDKLKTVNCATAYGANESGVISTLASANGISSYGLCVRFPDTTLTTEALINAYLSANPLQVVYELATPIEIDLTPTEVQTLLGTNVVWGNGEVEIEYAADVKAYIDSKIAAAVAAMN